MKLLTVAIIIASTAIACYKGAPVEQTQPPPVNACNEERNIERCNLNFKDYGFLSPYFAKNIITFRFSKETIMRSGECVGMKLVECKNTLLIQNNVSSRIECGYHIEYRFDTVGWKFSNTISIPANSTIDVGLINNDCHQLLGAQYRINVVDLKYR